MICTATKANGQPCTYKSSPWSGDRQLCSIHQVQAERGTGTTAPEVYTTGHGPAGDGEAPDRHYCRWETRDTQTTLSDGSCSGCARDVREPVPVTVQDCR